MSVSPRGRPFEPGKSGNCGGRPKVIGKLRDLSRAHAPEAIKELARLAMHAKNETARIAAIRELLDRGFGKPTQFLAADNDALPAELSAKEIRAEMLVQFQKVFPECRVVPIKRLKVISGPDETI
jgi:hypothetical protein